MSEELIGRYFTVEYRTGMSGSTRERLELVEIGNFYMRFKKGDIIVFIPFWNIFYMQDTGTRAWKEDDHKVPEQREDS